MRLRDFIHLKIHLVRGLAEAVCSQCFDPMFAGGAHAEAILIEEASTASRNIASKHCANGLDFFDTRHAIYTQR